MLDQINYSIENIISALQAVEWNSPVKIEIVSMRAPVQNIVGTIHLAMTRNLPNDVQTEQYLIKHLTQEIRGDLVKLTTETKFIVAIFKVFRISGVVTDLETFEPRLPSITIRYSKVSR